MQQSNLSDTQQSARPRLLVLASTFPRWVNDTEPAFIFELSRRLVPYFNVHLLAPHADGAAEHEVMAGIQVHRFRYAPSKLQTLSYDGGILSRLHQNKLRAGLIPLFTMAEAMAIRKLLKHYEFQVIHSHWIIPQTFALRIALIGLKRKPPILCTSHGGDLFGLQGRLMSAIKHWSLGCIKRMTVVSSAMQLEASKLTEQISSSVIPMGTCLIDRFTVDNRVKREESVILFVGRLVEKKGIIYLINAMISLLAKYPDLQLWIVGKGPNENELKRQVETLGLSGHVFFKGAVSHEQLPEIYRKASVTVVPSIIAEGGDQEGFGLVIVEAMGCGCPVIVSDLPAIRDTVPLNTMALKVKPANSEALAKAISITFDYPDEATQRANVALDYVQSKFDWGPISEKYRAELLRLIES